MDTERRVTRGRNKKPEPTVMLTRIAKVAKASLNTDVDNTPATQQDKEFVKSSSASTRISQPRVVSSSDVSSAITSEAPVRESVAVSEKQVESTIKQTNFPITLTTNTSSQAPYKITSTSSVNSSSYSTTTQETVEISNNAADNSSDINKLADYIRRSVSKTLSTKRETIGLRDGSPTASHNTVDGFRCSRSQSRSIYDDNESSWRGDADSVREWLNDKRPLYIKDKDIFSNRILCRQQTVPREFGGAYGITFLLVFCPCIVYYLQWCCSGMKCELKPFTLPTLSDLNYILKEIFHIEAMLAYFLCNTGLFILGTIMPGYSVRLPGYSKRRFIALPTSIVTLTAFAIAECLKFPVVDFYLKHFERFGIFAMVNAYAMAMRLFLRPIFLDENTDVQWNPYGKTGNFIIDYALGRQINPKWLRIIEFKASYYCTSLLMTFLYAICLLYKDVQVPVWQSDKQGLEMIYDFYNHLNYNPAVMLTSSMLLIYILDAIIFEHNLAASFEMKHEGCGALLLLRYSLTPYLLSSVAKYFYQYRYSSSIGYIILALSWALLSLGLFLKRYSNVTKYKYRLDPDHERFDNFETIHTFQSRRLLASTVWGWIRQPNYLGDILSLLALCVPLALKFAVVPVLNVALLIVLLVHRCGRVNKRNLDRYHSSWIRYCQTARYYLIPYVY